MLLIIRLVRPLQVSEIVPTCSGGKLLLLPRGSYRKMLSFLGSSESFGGTANMGQMASLLKRLAAFLGVLVLAAALVGLVAVAWRHSGTLVTATWHDELERAADNRVDELLDRFSTLGDDVIPLLAESLGSPREVVARAAKRVLWEHVVEWEAQPAVEVAPRYHLLADALAQRASHYGPESRRDALDIVTRLLSRHLAEPNGGSFLAACAKTLRADDSANGETIAAGGMTKSSAAASQTANQRGAIDLVMPRLPGGGLFLDMDDTAAADGGLSSLPPHTLPEGSQTAETLRRAPRTSEIDPSLDGPEGEGTSTANSARRLPVRQLAYRRDGDKDTSGTTARTTVDVRDVAQRLHDENPAIADEACEELQRRGFTKTDLELARRSTDPDPVVRKKLARDVLFLPGVDAGAWLLELCRDKSPDVRLEAITLLATTGDQALMKQVVRLGQMDEDERIQSVASRLSRQNAPHDKPAMGYLR